jgi:CRISPR-associated protein Cmr2
MTAHLLQLAIGPVQEFIAAARRTRDLWFGSHLLSEISKAGAKAVRDHGGNLIFPAPQNAADLERHSSLNVANILLAEVHDHDPATIARSVKEAVRARWLEFAEEVHSAANQIIRANIWAQQVDDVVEFYAAWVPFTRDNYKEQRQRLTRLLVGRKNCRDFIQAQGHQGVPKSSLDGLRETVLTDNRGRWPPRFRYGLRVREGEQLDVVGLVKRHALGKQSYPSVSRIAADSWLRGVVKNQGNNVLTRLVEACEQLAGGGLLNRLDCTRLHDDYARFRFEGTAVYRQRHHELIEETSERDEREQRKVQLQPLDDALRQVEQFARDAGLGAEPDPYVAVIVADGDRMGAAISRLASPEEHRRFSRQLAQFALDAAAVVRNQRGVLVYSGGDDVLGFAPVDKCLPCARELHLIFSQTMTHALPHVPEKERPTLSVGVAIGHFLENLEDLLGYGRAAEKAAKKRDRNGLAVHLHKRGGAPVKVRKQWSDDADSLDKRLEKYARWFLGGAVSNRTPYELHRLANLYDDWPDATLKDAIQRDAFRVIEKKRPGGEKTEEMQEIRLAVESHVNNADDLRDLAAELLIARQLAVALRQSGGGKKP